MKHIKTIIVLLLLAALFTTGCAVFHQPVPETKIEWTLGGQKGSLVNPKNTTVTNLDVSISTNGTAHMSIGYIASFNDSNVVSGAYAGAAQIVTATFDGSAKAFEAGAKAAGGALGAAVK